MFFISKDGKFAVDSEQPGTPAILAFLEIQGDNASLALEVRGPAVGKTEPVFRKALLKGVLNELLLQLGLAQRTPGRPHDSERAENIAYSRDHEHLTKQKLALKYCNCGRSQHTRLCFDKLNALADSYYSVQRSRFEKLVKSQAGKNL